MKPPKKRKPPKRRKPKSWVVWVAFFDGKPGIHVYEETEKDAAIAFHSDVRRCRLIEEPKDKP